MVDNVAFTARFALLEWTLLRDDARFQLMFCFTGQCVVNWALVDRVQLYYGMMKKNEKIVKYLKDVRKPKNSEHFVKTARTSLSHIQF